MSVLLSVFLNGGGLKQVEPRPDCHPLREKYNSRQQGTANDNAANVGYTKDSISRKNKIILQIVP